MADAHSPAQTDRDLASMAEARALVRRAKAAQAVLAEFTQERIDAIVEAMAKAAAARAEALATAAVEETGYGNVADKVRKNRFASEKVHAFIRGMRTVGIVNRDEGRKVVEIAEPFGVVAAIIPSTNPTSTAIYKILISIKARCAVVLSPHPAAVGCITATAELMDRAGRAAGLPEGALGWMTVVTLEGTQELMRQRETAVILATGGMGLVRAAYGVGKPAYGVGPGNAPAYIEKSADVAKAVSDIVTGKTFDNGVLCSSENSVVVDAEVADAARSEFRKQGAHFLTPEQADVLGRLLVTPQRLPNPQLVGKSATFIAERAGIPVPQGTRVLIAELAGVGREFPLSIEKLCPVLSFYVVRDWREGCERCKQILRYGGMGHTMAIHSRNDEVILEFGLHKPAYRIVVNTPTSLGSIGQTTGLDPALTLGCGGFGGNITSDNITPRHLLNIKRLAYEVTPVAALDGVGTPLTEGGANARGPSALDGRIEAFLASRGISSAAPPVAPAAPAPVSGLAGPSPAASDDGAAVDFVCEDDVRVAMRGGRRIRLADKAIVTPAARDLGDEHGVFI